MAVNVSNRKGNVKNIRSVSKNNYFKENNELIVGTKEDATNFKELINKDIECKIMY